MDGRRGAAGDAGGAPGPHPPVVQGPGQEGELALLALHLLQGCRVARLVYSILQGRQVSLLNTAGSPG